jgi:hypothetical protein
LSNPASREVHLERSKSARKKRLCSPARREVHLESLKSAQKKRLSNPASREVHLERLKSRQRTRLSNPASREVHLERLKCAQKKRLRNYENWYVHCNRLRFCQQNRMSNLFVKRQNLSRVRRNEIECLKNFNNLKRKRLQSRLKKHKLLKIEAYRKKFNLLSKNYHNIYEKVGQLSKSVRNLLRNIFG